LFIPLGTDHEKSRIPFVTYWLIGANVILFALAVPFGVQRIAEALGYLPSSPNPITIVTHMFLHGGILHLLFNMVFLWCFGPDVEDVLGPILFAALYFACGFAALAIHHITSAIFIPSLLEEPVVGSSGAIAGVMGLHVVRFWRYKVKMVAVLFFYPMFFRVPAILLIGAWFFGQLMLGVNVLTTPELAKAVPVAFWAHIGGFSAGLGFAFLLKLQRQATMEYRWADASSAIEKGRWWQAIEAYQDIAKRFPNDPTPVLQSARCWEATGNKRRMAEAYRTAFELAMQGEYWEIALDAYADLRQAAPEMEIPQFAPWQWLTLASLYHHKGRHGPALEVYRRIVRAFPESEQAPISLLRSAEIFVERGRNATAVRILIELLRHYPSSQWAQLAHQRLTELQE